MRLSVLWMVAGLILASPDAIRADQAAEAAARNREVAARYASGDAHGAYALGEKALARNRQALGPDHLEVARALSMLALRERAKEIRANSSP